jgi:outer membrane protein
VSLLPLALAARVLTLDEAVRTAQAHQPQIRAAWAQVHSGQARVGEAKAGLFPRLDANAQYQRSTANFPLSPSFSASSFAVALKGQPNLLSPGATVNFYTFGITATQTIYDFGRTFGALDQAHEGEQVNRADLEATSQNILLNVRTAYFSVLAAKELVWVGEETLKNQGKHVQQVQQFVSAGTRPKIDLRSAELNLANAELALLRARNGFDLAKVALNQAMGIEGPTDFDVAEPAEQTLGDESSAVDDLMPEALRGRPEYLRVEAEVRAQEASRRIAKSGYFPALQAFGNFSGTKVSDTKNGDFDWGLNWYVGAGLTWNLFNGMFTQRQVEDVDAGLEGLAAQRDLVRQQIRSELEAQLLAVGQAKESLRVSDRAVVTGEERLKLAEGRYQAGAGDILELDDAQVAYSNAKAQRVTAQYDLATARARLAHALGKK